jgi:hypothetical protein
MATTDWTSLRYLATVALERSNRPLQRSLMRETLSVVMQMPSCLGAMWCMSSVLSFQVVFNALESRLYPSIQAAGGSVINANGEGFSLSNVICGFFFNMAEGEILPVVFVWTLMRQGGKPLRCVYSHYSEPGRNSTSPPVGQASVFFAAVADPLIPQHVPRLHLNCKDSRRCPSR